MFSNPEGYSQTRAVGNLNALPENEANHIKWLFSLSNKEFSHAISTMKPGTGQKPHPRHLIMLQVIWDLEKAFKFRQGILDRISTAMRANRQTTTV